MVQTVYPIETVWQHGNSSREYTPVRVDRLLKVVPVISPLN